MESIIIGLIFVSAITYLGNIVRKNFSLKNKAGCSKGCGSCGAIDFEKIAADMEAQR
ncbi:MAG: FeoB-associated Cys-rich membrane protein [Bacteroidota bacterium]